MKNALTLNLVIVITILFGSGCRMIGMGKTNYLEGKNAQEAVEKVKAQIGKPFKVFSVAVEETEIRLQAQDPTKPQNLDEYRITNGFLSGPNPIKLNALQKDLEKSTFPIDGINFAAIPEFTREAAEKAKIEGGRVTRLEFQRAFAMTETNAGALGNARWIIQIEGSRESASAFASPEGKLAGVDLSATTRGANYKVITPEELQKASDALKTNPGGSAKIAKLIIYEDYLACNVETPENPNVADEYKFGINGLTRSKVDNIPQSRFQIFKDFSLSEINLLNAADFIAKARQQTEMPESVFASMSVQRKQTNLEKNNFQIIWSVSLKQGINEATVVFNNSGKVIRVSRNGKTILEEEGD